MFRQILSITDRTLSSLERVMLGISMCAILATSIIVLIGIGSREILPFRIPDDTTIVEQLMVVSIAFGLGYVTHQRTHIAIDLFYTHFTPRFQTICDAIAVAAGIIAFAPITYWALHDVTKFLISGRYYYGEMQMLEWPTRGIFFFGLLVMVVRLVLIFLDRLTGGQTSEPTN